MNKAMNQNICLNCAADDNEADARFCQTCGMKLTSKLHAPPVPPLPCEAGTKIDHKFIIDALLWTAPTYNAYSAHSAVEPQNRFTLIEQGSDIDYVQDETTKKTAKRLVSGSLENAAAVFEKLGLIKPVEQLSENSR